MISKLIFEMFLLCRDLFSWLAVLFSSQDTFSFKLLHLHSAMLIVIINQISDFTDLNLNVCFKWEGAISSLSGSPLKLVDQFTYLSSNILSTKSDVNIHLEMV